MAVVGSEDNPVIADDVDHMRQLFFFGFAGEIKLSALQEFARFGF